MLATHSPAVHGAFGPRTATFNENHTTTSRIGLQSQTQTQCYYEQKQIFKSMSQHFSHITTSPRRVEVLTTKLAVRKRMIRWSMPCLDHGLLGGTSWVTNEHSKAKSRLEARKPAEFDF
jgi:hypothetical protein